MSKTRDEASGTGPAPNSVHYIVQVWNKETGVWQDVPKKFESLDDLACYAIMKIPWTAITRMITVDRRGGRHEHKLWDAFGEPR